LQLASTLIASAPWRSKAERLISVFWLAGLIPDSTVSAQRSSLLFLQGGPLSSAQKRQEARLVVLWLFLSV
jgi:hypothetical protein